MSELRGLGAVHSMLQARAGSVVALAADPVDRAREVVRRQQLAFPVLADVGAQVARQFGLLHRGGDYAGADIAVPAQLLVGRDGRVLWRYVSATVQDRVDPEATAAAVRDALTK